jgi:hypothetical protein
MTKRREKPSVLTETYYLHFLDTTIKAENIYIHILIEFSHEIDRGRGNNINRTVTTIRVSIKLQKTDWNFPCQTIKISKVSRVVMGS